MKEIYGIAASAIGWCIPFLVNWILSRKNKTSSLIFLSLMVTSLGCHISAIAVVLLFNCFG